MEEQGRLAAPKKAKAEAQDLPEDQPQALEGDVTSGADPVSYVKTSSPQSQTTVPATTTKATGPTLAAMPQTLLNTGTLRFQRGKHSGSADYHRSARPECAKPHDELVLRWILHWTLRRAAEGVRRNAGVKGSRSELVWFALLFTDITEIPDLPNGWSPIALYTTCPQHCITMRRSRTWRSCC